MHYQREIPPTLITGWRRRPKHAEGNLSSKVVFTSRKLRLPGLNYADLIMDLNERDDAGLLRYLIHLGDLLDFLIESDGGPWC